jgi:phospholipid/cholesterol/gamma-HCH transport system substrate-binding protein
VAQAQTFMNDINAGKGTMGKLARDEALYNEATTAMTNLREIFQKINQGQGSAGKLVNDEGLYKNAKLSLQKLDKAMEGLEDQGPLSVLGIAVNSLF